MPPDGVSLTPFYPHHPIVFVSSLINISLLENRRLDKIIAMFCRRIDVAIKQAKVFFSFFPKKKRWRQYNNRKRRKEKQNARKKRRKHRTSRRKRVVSY